MAVDVENACAVLGAVDDVVLKDLIVKRRGGGVDHVARRCFSRIALAEWQKSVAGIASWEVAVQCAHPAQPGVPLDSDLNVRVQIGLCLACGAAAG